jgi:hypothetical protein
MDAISHFSGLSLSLSLSLSGCFTEPNRTLDLERDMSWSLHATWQLMHCQLIETVLASC